MILEPNRTPAKKKKRHARKKVGKLSLIFKLQLALPLAFISVVDRRQAFNQNKITLCALFFSLFIYFLPS